MLRGNATRSAWVASVLVGTLACGGGTPPTTTNGTGRRACFLERRDVPTDADRLPDVGEAIRWAPELLAARPSLTSEPSTHDTTGTLLFRRGLYDKALEEWERALRVGGGSRLLVSIARAYAAMKDDAGAHAALDAYLRRNGAELDPTHRAALEGELAAHAARTSWVVVLCKDVEAVFRLDDTVLGRCPLRLRVNRTKHRLEAADPCVPQQVEVDSTDSAAFELVVRD